MNENIDLKKLSKEYLKSYYSINTYIGCTINCGYCFLAPIKIVPMRPIKVIDEEKLIAEMLSDKYFKEGQTVISINNRTDPFITEEVKQSTFQLLDIMGKNKLKNIVTITTKALLTEEDAKKLDNYKNIKIVIIVTYNGIPFKIQPIAQEIQEETMINISKCKNVKLLHQFRPIIPGINDDEKKINEVVTFAHKYCDATIYQGLRVNPFIKERLDKRDYNYIGKFDQHKQKSSSTDTIFEKLKSKYKNYPIFDHTSCCLSYLYGKPDYNLHYTKINCSRYCKNYEKCHNAMTIFPENLKQQLKYIGVDSKYEIKDDKLLIYGALNDEQKSYIKHILHIPVKSTQRENTYSEQIMEGIK